MRLPSFVMMALILVLTAGCGNVEQGNPSGNPDGRRPAGSAGEDLSSSARTFPLDSPTTVVGFGGGSLWVVDYGNYECDDTPGIEASCASPERVFLKRLDPDTREATATIPLRDTGGASVAFGAGSAWVSYANYSSPRESGILRVDLETNEVVRRIPTEKPPLNVAFGEGSVWLTSELSGVVSRIDPAADEVVEEIQTGKSEVGGIAVGGGSVWVASYGLSDASTLPEEAYEKDTLPRPNPEARLVRLDPEKGEVAAEVPVEDTALEGGASDAAIGEDAVWVTSVNAKLLRVDPGTNEAVTRADIGDYAFDVEVGEGSVWTTSEVNVNSANAYTIRLTRLDQRKGEVSGSLDEENMSGLAVGGGAVWIGLDDVKGGRGGLIRITP